VLTRTLSSLYYEPDCSAVIVHPNCMLLQGFISVLQLRLGLPNGLFSSDITTEVRHFLSHACYMPAHSISLDFATVILLHEK
jgi:hypothetical protein